MNGRTFFVLTALAIVCCWMGSGCKKSKPAAKMDPHSPEAVNVAMQQQRLLISEAFRTNDLTFIHNQMYYLGTFADALSRKLEGEKKARVDAILRDLKAVCEAIDNSAGRKQKEATEANLGRFYEVLSRLDAEFRVANPAK